jgi:hypothetical protein
MENEVLKDIIRAIYAAGRRETASVPGQKHTHVYYCVSDNLQDERQVKYRKNVNKEMT